jgi:hypothetical protein
MDGDSIILNNAKTDKKENNCFKRYLTNVSDVLSPIWVRRTFQINNGFEWFILGSRYRFLFYFRVLLVILYITYTTFK